MEGGRGRGESRRGKRRSRRGHENKLQLHPTVQGLFLGPRPHRSRKPATKNKKQAREGARSRKITKKASNTGQGSTARLAFSWPSKPAASSTSSIRSQQRAATMRRPSAESLYWRSERACVSQQANRRRCGSVRTECTVQACRQDGGRARKLADGGHGREAPLHLPFLLSALWAPSFSRSLSPLLAPTRLVFIFFPFLRLQGWMEGPTTHGVMTDCYCGDFDCAAACCS